MKYFPEITEGNIGTHRVVKTRIPLSVNSTDTFCNITKNICEKEDMQLLKCTIESWYDYYEIQAIRNKK